LLNKHHRLCYLSLLKITSIISNTTNLIKSIIINNNEDKFIILRDDSAVEFFGKFDQLLTAAKAERLLDYLYGKTHVKSEADVEVLNKVENQLSPDCSC